MRDDQRVLPDPGCYQERYRMTAGALPTVGASVAMIGLLFRGEVLWAAGVIIAVALAILLGPALAARRMIAFRADYAGLTFGPAASAPMIRRGPRVFIGWGEVDTIIPHPDVSGIVGTEGRVGRIEVRRRDQADAITRTVSGWRLNRERLTAVTAAVAPGIPVIERPPAAPGPPSTGLAQCRRDDRGFVTRLGSTGTCGPGPMTCGDCATRSGCASRSCSAAASAGTSR